MASEDTLLVPLGAGAAVGALLGALLVGVSGHFYLSRLKEKGSKGWVETTVLSAARDIPKGELLADADVVERRVPAQCATGQAFRPPELPRGSRARVDLRKGDVLERNLLTGVAL